MPWGKLTWRREFQKRNPRRSTRYIISSLRGLKAEQGVEVSSMNRKKFLIDECQGTTEACALLLPRT
jgi:hypothetical protein